MNGLIKKLRRSQRFLAGFTLLEVLVVVLIIAVLAAIAAPGWNALMNRQRVNVVNEQAVQLIRQAQNDARRTHTPRLIVFDPNATVPRAAIVPLQRDFNGNVLNPIVDLTTINAWTTLGNNEVKDGALEFSTTPADGQLVFNGNGFVDRLTTNAIGNDPSISRTPESATSRVFVFKVRQRNTTAQTNRCVIVRTILGATDTDQGTRCEI